MNRKEYFKHYNEINKDKIKEYLKHYNKINKDKRNLYSKNYYKSNRESVLKKQKIYYELNKTEIINKNRNRYLKRKFGITIDDYNEMLTLQLSGCSICGKSINDNGNKLDIDHDHKTGKVRGLLCKNCNKGIGLFYENINILEGAINYIKKYNKLK